MSENNKKPLRSQAWFNDPEKPVETAIYLERYMNFGLTREELQSGKPIIGIAQTGNDLVPCNRHLIELAGRVKDGIREAGGIALEFPVHPLQETGKRPTAALDRNLAYLGLVEVLYGYPLDGVVLTTGCDKTTPACLMAAATVDIPAIVLSGGPMLNGHHKGRQIGSGTIVWEARKQLASGEITYEQCMELIAAGSPSVGHCNTMGTALSMNCLAEGLGMSLPGCASIPAPYRERGQMAFETGRRAVELVECDLRPSDIITREALDNAIALNSAIGGSTNTPIHLNAIARHLGIELDNAAWQKVGHDLPLLVDLQPAGRFLAEDFHKAGGVPSVMAELLKANLLPFPENRTVSGGTVRSVYRDCESLDQGVIRPAREPLQQAAGFINLGGNLFRSAIMKTSVISKKFRKRYLSDPTDPDAFECRAIVFEGPEDYRQRIDDPDLGCDENSILIIRGCGPIGYPGGAEVVNMQPPASLIKQGIKELPCLGDGRQSGTSGSPSILNASPEAAAAGGLALIRTGDMIRVDLSVGEVNVLLDAAELSTRESDLQHQNGFSIPEHQTPWQEIQRTLVDQLDNGMVLKSALKYQRISDVKGLPRDSH